MNIDQDIKINQDNVLFTPDRTKFYNYQDQDENHVNMIPHTNNTLSLLNRSSMMTYSKIVCCICSGTIDANERGMCNTCARSEIVITEGIMKTGLILYCKGCDRYQRPPWVRCGNGIESPEMMAFILPKIKGLNKVKLVDSSFVWTEPHSKIIKIKLTVQKEMNKSMVESNLIVEFKVEWTQCDDCKKTFTPHVWSASCQIRQKVNHKRTFMMVEQIVLKNRAHVKALNVKEHPEGVDFYFSNKSQALSFADFIKTALPAKVKQSKQLVSMDDRSNLYNYKYTFMIELAPVCKDDLIVLNNEICKALGGCGAVLLCYKLSSKMHLLDPISFNTYEFDSNTYWRHEFKSYVDRKCLSEFMIMNVEEEIDYTKKYINSSQYTGSDIEMSSSASANNTKANQSKSTAYRDKANVNLSSIEKLNKYDHFKVVTVQCIELNKSEGDAKLITIRSHLGGKIKPGDIYFGYNVKGLNLSEELEGYLSDATPDVILVKKKYIRTDTNARKRYWKLKHLQKDVEMTGKVKNPEAEEAQYEEFLRDIEEDKDLRKAVNLYKDDEVIKELEGKFQELKVHHEDSEIDIRVDELLDNLTINDKDDLDLNQNKTKKNDSIDILENEEVIDTFEKPNPVTKTKGNKKQIGKRDRKGNYLHEDDK